MTRLLAVTLLVSWCGCRGNTPAPAGPAPRPDAGAPVATGSGSVAIVSDALTERDCDALLAHVVQVSVAERPADQQIDANEMSSIQGEARPQFMAECRAMPRATFDCAMAAKATAAVEACR